MKNFKLIGIESIRNYTVSNKTVSVLPNRSQIVNVLALKKDNVVSPVISATGEFLIGSIGLDEALTYKAMVELSKSDSGFDVKKLGYEAMKSYHLENAYHKALSIKLNAITKTTTTLEELISKAPITEGNILCVNATEMEKINAYTVATKPLGLDKLQVLLIDGLENACIFNINEVEGRIVKDEVEIPLDTEMALKGISRFAFDIYLGLSFFGTVIK